jgi:hypothetical protein
LTAVGAPCGQCTKVRSIDPLRDVDRGIGREEKPGAHSEKCRRVARRRDVVGGLQYGQRHESARHLGLR